MKTITPSSALGAFVLRLALGIVFLAHGGFKLLVLGLPATAAYFADHGFPGWSAYPVFALEGVGGTLVLVGFGTRWVALALIPVAVGALLVHAPNGWYFGAPGGGWEYLAVLVAALAAQALLGDGAYALGSLHPRRRDGSRHRDSSPSATTPERTA